MALGRGSDRGLWQMRLVEGRETRRPGTRTPSEAGACLAPAEDGLEGRQQQQPQPVREIIRVHTRVFDSQHSSASTYRCFSFSFFRNTLKCEAGIKVEIKPVCTDALSNPSLESAHPSPARALSNRLSALRTFATCRHY